MTPPRAAATHDRTQSFDTYSVAAAAPPHLSAVCLSSTQRLLRSYYVLWYLLLLTML
jgi:hypothetical protein